MWQLPHTESKSPLSEIISPQTYHINRDIKSILPFQKEFRSALPKRNRHSERKPDLIRQKVKQNPFLRFQTHSPYGLKIRDIERIPMSMRATQSRFLWLAETSSVPLSVPDADRSPQTPSNPLNHQTDSLAGHYLQVHSRTGSVPETA